MSDFVSPNRSLDPKTTVIIYPFSRGFLRTCSRPPCAKEVHPVFPPTVFFSKSGCERRILVFVNGYEVAGGSLRIYKPDMQEAIFTIMGNKIEDIREKFKHLLDAFKYGVPPHGGIASGLDRLFAILLAEPNIREVMAFPKTGDARDPMMDSPSEISKEQLKELHLKIDKK